MLKELKKKTSDHPVVRMLRKKIKKHLTIQLVIFKLKML